MAKLYRLAAKGLVLLDEKGKPRTEKVFITDDHPAFAGQRHKLVEVELAALGTIGLTRDNLMGQLDRAEALIRDVRETSGRRFPVTRGTAFVRGVRRGNDSVLIDLDFEYEDGSVATQVLTVQGRQADAIRRAPSEITAAATYASGLFAASAPKIEEPDSPIVRDSIEVTFVRKTGDDASVTIAFRREDGSDGKETLRAEGDAAAAILGAEDKKSAGLQWVLATRFSGGDNEGDGGEEESGDSEGSEESGADE